MTDIEDAKDRIKEEIKNLRAGHGHYSRNIIGIELRSIDKNFGVSAANKVIDELKLEKLGFNKEPEE